LLDIDEIKLEFDYLMMKMFAFYMLISIKHGVSSLKQRSWGYMSLYWDTLSCSKANMSLLFLL